ncbi:hypothetical protein PF008_g28917 [Phytophthora fragariae]|uniref:RxLR effector protein n=1 Tax=Phytophthora fragariae TaxID=53985 RepID=A0A6G0Q9W7_9STRA|nr:hypothetical protein PF008_g28917 [Phytophthora fragariae]
MTSILPRCSIAGVFLPLLSSVVTSCLSPGTSSICTAQTPPTPSAATPSLPPSTTAPVAPLLCLGSGPLGLLTRRNEAKSRDRRDEVV